MDRYLDEREEKDRRRITLKQRSYLYNKVLALEKDEKERVLRIIHGKQESNIGIDLDQVPVSKMRQV